MNDDGIIEAIRSAIEVSDYSIDLQHLAPHMAAEGFNQNDVVTAVTNGDVIEAVPERSRWLFCGNVPSLRLSVPFLGLWLHVSVEYIEEFGTAIVTAYRPNTFEFRTERVRR